MRYFLDFDRTLFDTDAFNAALPDEPGCAEFSEELRAVVARGRDETLTGGAARAAAWKKLDEAVVDGRLSFAPGYLSRFLYGDVLEGLSTLGSNAAIITFGNRRWQQAKVESALPECGLDVVYVDSSFKAEAFAVMEGFVAENSVLVDDRVAELAAVAEALPALQLFEMRRDGREGDGRWPVIRSLSELPLP